MMFKFAVFLITLVAMEGVGTLAHKYVMHGWGWCLHRSHHEPHLGALETNDLYLVALALAAIGLIVFGNAGHAPWQWVGAGVAGYGLIYVIAHDGIVHRQWPVRPRPRHRYLRRLYEAHRLHHQVKGRQNSVSFGFLYAPPVAKIEQQLQRTAEQGEGCGPQPRV
ncbi:MAG: sterol desaturase family protein [Pseudomonas sp.]|uniref:sterol desaturase family protein n=1 Tax=Pseudomonas abieticivorans TaxID=2931382 RepID=UPI0020BE8158|nr:sterol desaturase family protein [Pseudomonas sp. PIA16]MDE1169413.1 sterol desaturase family protein [Pseudomonas sp.]